MARKIAFTEREFYHLYNRGTEKRHIFAYKDDYVRFQTLLYLCNGSKPLHFKALLKSKSNRGRTSVEVMSKFDRGEPLVELAAYCLMPNHFHILARELQSRGISRFMQKLITAYTMYYNVKNERSGVLFQGKYKSVHADTDNYLKYLISYIHLNPVKLIDPRWKENGISSRKEAEKYLERYQYSSYLDYTGKDRMQTKILCKTSLPDYFTTPSEFKKNIIEWLNNKD